NLHYPEHLNFCRRCGNALAETMDEPVVEAPCCTRCGARFVSGENFCQQCGCKLSQRSQETVVGGCYGCGTPWRSGWLYCRKCGLDRDQALIGPVSASAEGVSSVATPGVDEPEEVERVADAGGQFIVSPNRDLRVIARTKQLGLASLPGCFTPSEVVEALAAGADAIKLFPVQPLGVDFVRAIQGPLPGIRLVPTGGVTPEMAQRYFAAGAWAVGVGSELLNRELAAEPDLVTMRSRARYYTGVASSGGAKTVK
ncbi:MAG: hypothetical protein EBU88_14765, partial [Acidobacteria bacterium]|nr:hypothetical protein [Acidobacteriota bacterium]